MSGGGTTPTPTGSSFGGFGKSDFSNVSFGKSDFSDVSFNKSPADALGQDLGGMGFQPPNVGVGANQTASMPQGVSTAIPQTPAAQASTGVANTGTDWKGMAKDLGTGLKAVQEQQKQMQDSMAGAKTTPAQVAPQAAGGVMGTQMAMPQAQSGAMQAMMGNQAMLSPMQQQMQQPMQPMGIQGVMKSMYGM
jgi:hypothetical protein